MREFGDVILQRSRTSPASASFTGSTGGAQTANTGRFFIVLKPRDERELTASQIIDRLRPQLAKVEGANLFLQPTQDITVGGRISRASFQYTLQDSNVAELNEWSDKMLDKMRTLPQIADASSDLLANAPQLKITINRDQASRFGISPQMIDDTLNDAFGQRQIAQYFTQLKTYFDHPRNPARACSSDLASLDRLYVKSPLTGGAVPLSTLVDVDTSKVGPLSVAHQGQFPAVTLTLQPAARRRARPGGRCHHQGRARDRHAVLGDRRPSRATRRRSRSSLSSEPVLIAAALIVVYIILGMLYESFIHPLTILSTLPSAGVGALLALQARPHGPLGDRHHRHHSADRHRQEERHHAGRLRDHRRARPPHAARSRRSARPACCASGRS